MIFFVYLLELKLADISRVEIDSYDIRTSNNLWVTSSMPVIMFGYDPGLRGQENYQSLHLSFQTGYQCSVSNILIFVFVMRMFSDPAFISMRHNPYQRGIRQNKLYFSLG